MAVSNLQLSHNENMPRIANNSTIFLLKHINNTVVNLCVKPKWIINNNFNLKRYTVGISNVKRKAAAEAMCIWYLY